MTVVDNAQVVNKLKQTLEGQGVSVSSEDLSVLVKKNRLIKDVEKLLNEGHTRAEIDKTVKQVLQDRAAKGATH